MHCRTCPIFWLFRRHKGDARHMDESDIWTIVWSSMNSEEVWLCWVELGNPGSHNPPQKDGSIQNSTLTVSLPRGSSRICHSSSLWEHTNTALSTFGTVLGLLEDQESLSLYYSGAAAFMRLLLWFFLSSLLEKRQNYLLLGQRIWNYRKLYWRIRFIHRCDNWSPNLSQRVSSW